MDIHKKYTHSNSGNSSNETLGRRWLLNVVTKLRRAMSTDPFETTFKKVDIATPSAPERRRRSLFSTYWIEPKDRRADKSIYSSTDQTYDINEDMYSHEHMEKILPAIASQDEVKDDWKERNAFFFRNAAIQETLESDYYWYDNEKKRREQEKEQYYDLHRKRMEEQTEHDLIDKVGELSAAVNWYWRPFDKNNDPKSFN